MNPVFPSELYKSFCRNLFYYFDNVSLNWILSCKPLLLRIYIHKDIKLDKSWYFRLNFGNLHNKALCSSIYKFGLSVCLGVWVFVCLFPINVWTAEPIGPNFFVGHHVTPGKVYEWSKFKNLCLKVFYFCKVFLKILNPRIFL